MSNSEKIMNQHFPTFKKRFFLLRDKWIILPPHHKTILKLLPIFIVLAAIPLTVDFLQQQQNLSQEAAQKCKGNNKFCLTPTPVVYNSPTPTPTITYNTPTPTANYTPTPTPTSSGAWVNAINDQFDSGGIPSHWSLYNGPYGSGPHNCAIPSQVTVSGGYMHMLMSYLTTGICGAGWYTGGMMLSSTYQSINQRVTVKFRVVNNGVQGHFIIPMRWPSIDSSWPAAGEEDYCETSSLSGCSTYLHYGASNSQVSHNYAVDLSQWHTIRTVRQNYTVNVYIDDMTTPAWTYAGNSTTLPDTLKRVVLQQECQASGCPSGTTGTQDIQIDWITVDNP